LWHCKCWLRRAAGAGFKGGFAPEKQG